MIFVRAVRGPETEREGIEAAREGGPEQGWARTAGGW